MKKLNKPGATSLPNAWERNPQITFHKQEDNPWKDRQRALGKIPTDKISQGGRGEGVEARESHVVKWVATA